MREKRISNIESHFQNKNSNTDWIEKLFEDERNESDLKYALNNKWEEILNESTNEVDLKHILYKIHYYINSKSRKNSKSRQLYNYFARIASVLVLPLLVISIMWGIKSYNTTEQYSQIIAQKGEKVRFILPDGSSGYLNSGSTLKYTYPFTTKRTVELNGEAFFDVVHSKKEFVVQTNKLNIEVHGTHFNVCAYNNDSDIIATLVDGSISAISNVDGKRIKLKPHQQAIFNKANNSLTYEEVDVDLYVSWKDNILRFNNTSFIDVVKKMERWYDVKISLDDKLKNTHRYTMSIKTESIREMLDLISVTTPMQYEIKEDTIFIRSKKETPME